MYHILRDIKLSELTNTPMSGETSKFVKLWDDLWIDMKIYINTDKGEIRCCKDGYDCNYFYQHNKNARLWCDYDKVWAFFGYNLKLKYSEIQELIQYMVGETLNCEVNTPKFQSFIF